MKTWKRYENFLLTGEWHVHTSFTDGKNTIDDYCAYADNKKIPLIVFTEHVRKELSYDFNLFLEQIDLAREQYELIILSGCEVKILPYGNFDVSDSIIQEVDYPLMVFHSFPCEYSLYIESLSSALKNPQVNAWGHPGVLARTLGWQLSSISDILKIAKENDVLLEINNKYNTPPIEWKEEIDKNKIRLVRGNDIHDINQMSVF